VPDEVAVDLPKPSAPTKVPGSPKAASSKKS